MLLIGIDQSQDKHDVCITDAAGRQLAREVISNKINGFQRVPELCHQFEVSPEECRVALESAHSLLVDHLLDADFRICVIPGRSVDRYRDRHRQSSSASDKEDAAVLARILLTDRDQYQLLEADSPLTRQIGSQVSLVMNLKRTCLRLGNQLRNLLWRYYPLPVEMFTKLEAPVSLAFIQAYPTPQAALRLSQAEFTAFCRAQRFWRTDHVTSCYAKLRSFKTYASPVISGAYATQAQALARTLGCLVNERKTAQKELTRVFQQHPDAFIFTSLPGAGELLAPALLSKFRDCRVRFPSPSVAQAIAGTCPVTEQSGKRKKRILFRLACDREFRYIATQFARSSVKTSPWARAYFETVRPRCDKASQAYRRLANRWIAIIWRLWTDRIEYDEAVHLRNRLVGRASS